jgi:hypothetical protein
VITPWVTSGVSALAEQAPGLVEVVFGVDVSLIVILAMVGSMHPDEKCRADAQKVLDRLLWQGEGRTGG